ncbi:MAG: sodium:glutamate symporter [Gammaproteobacteria bacterium]|nr:sodium:glutamate symporter [Gammaproteobacteria bacterium]
MAATFPGVIAFAFLVSMILAGVILRARIPFLQNNLVPASLIGGVLGFMLVSSGLSLGFDNVDFTPFAFHFFTLSFMSLVLTGSESTGKSGGSVVPGGMWMSVIWIMSLVLQALVGLAVILVFNQVSGGDLSYFLGVIATHGFTQGPGQALALGSIWENELGITHAINFGLIYASVGFLMAFVVGVPVARRAIRAGLNFNQSARIDDEFLRGILTSEVSAGRQVTHSANVDSLVFHIAILGVAYVFTDQYLKFVYPFASTVSIGGVNLGIIFSHNLFFIHGLINCVILRALMNKFGYGHFIDNETQRRITGSSVDLMVVATIMSVEFAFLSEFIVPIGLVSLAVTLVTAALCFGFGRKLRSYGVERAVTVFGCCCGSTGSGLLLLRILDPDLSTPVAKELAFFNIAILFLGFHVLTVMAPVLPGFSLITICVVYIGTFVVGAITVTFMRRFFPTLVATGQ